MFGTLTTDHWQIEKMEDMFRREQYGQLMERFLGPRGVMMQKIENRLNENSYIPEFLFPLFWEYEPESVDIFKHADLVISRIMARGTWASMLWLRKTYSRNRLVSFLEKRGRRVLPPRELNYWAFMGGISAEKREKWVKESREKSDVWGTKHAH